MYRFFHLCEHTITDKAERDYERKILVRNQNGLNDLIVKGASILEILEVRAIEYKARKKPIQLKYDALGSIDTFDHPDYEKAHYDAPHYFYQDYSTFFEKGAKKSKPLPAEFYSIHLKNRILWRVEPPTYYEVTAVVRYDQNVIRTVSSTECDKCQGRGWYVDILNNSGGFEKDTGTIKVVQRLVKDIMTDLFSSVLKREYGTLIKKTIANNSRNDEELFDDIRMIVAEVEQRYLQRQINEYSSLASSERLISAKPIRISRANRDKRVLVLDLQIITEGEDRVFRLGL